MNRVFQPGGPGNKIGVENGDILAPGLPKTICQGPGLVAGPVFPVDITYLETFRLHEGQTLYKGRSDVELTVYDMLDEGKIVYHEVLPEIKYPVTAGQHIGDTSEREFRRKFIDVMATEIGYHFHPHSVDIDFGTDAELLDLEMR